MIALAARRIGRLELDERHAGRHRVAVAREDRHDLARLQGSTTLVRPVAWILPGAAVYIEIRLNHAQAQADTSMAQSAMRTMRAIGEPG